MNSTDKEVDQEAGDINHESYGRGCLFFDKGAYREAISCFREALEYWPEDSEAWLALGNCYDACGKSRKAEKSYRKSLDFQTDKTRDAALFNLGNALYDQSQFKEAMECYDKVSSSSKVYPTARINIERAKSKVV